MPTHIIGHRGQVRCYPSSFFTFLILRDSENIFTLLILYAPDPLRTLPATFLTFLPSLSAYSLHCIQSLSIHPRPAYLRPAYPHSAYPYSANPCLAYPCLFNLVLLIYALVIHILFFQVRPTFAPPQLFFAFDPLRPRLFVYSLGLPYAYHFISSN